MHSNWEKLPTNEIKNEISKLVNEVRAKINCHDEHEIEVYHLTKWPRAFRLNCNNCHREVFVKSFAQDAGVNNKERHLRYNIERINLENLAHKNLHKGLFSNGSFSIPQLIGYISFPHYAIIEEFINSDNLGEAILNTIRSRNSNDLLNALSLLAKYLVTLHERTINNEFKENILSLNDPINLINKFGNIDEYDEILAELRSFHLKWIEDNFFKNNLLSCLTHNGLTPVNVLYSSPNRQLSVTDFETLHYDTPFVDIGTVTAELKLSFVINADNSYLAEPYIGYFLREYFAHQNKINLTYRQFTWVQSFFMGRRLLIIAQGEWLDQSLKRWCLNEVKNIWGLINQKHSFISPPFLGIKAVFFDFYNTLVSVEDDEYNLKNFEKVRDYVITNWLKSKADNFPSAEDLREMYFSVIKEIYEESKEMYPDIDLEVVWAETFERLKIEIPTFILYYNHKEKLRSILAIFRESAIKHFEVFEGTIDAIKAIKSHNIKIGIISDAQIGYIEAELKRMDIFHFIDCFLFSADFRFRKPDRRYFEWGLRRLGLNPDEAVFVGDDMFRDIFGAQQVGMHTIFKPSDHTCSFYEGCNPDEVVVDFRKFPELFGISP
jgi:putative hydrolase of the HAD superfamily